MRSARAACALVLSLCLAACTTVRVDPVDAEAHPLREVCIERNPRVLVRAMLPAVRDAFRRNRVATVVREPGEFEDCEYMLRYSALRGGTLIKYTKIATIELFRGEAEIGRIDYEHHGWLDITKFARTADKLAPLIERLLEGAGG